MTAIRLCFFRMITFKMLRFIKFNHSGYVLYMYLYCGYGEIIYTEKYDIEYNNYDNGIVYGMFPFHISLLSIVSRD